MNEQVPDAVEVPFDQTLEYLYPETTHAGEVVVLSELDKDVQSAVSYAFNLLEVGHEDFRGTHGGVQVIAMNYCSELEIDPDAYGRWLRSPDRVLVQVSEGTYGDLFDPEGSPVEDLGALVVILEKDKLDPKGGRVFGPIPREMAEKGYQKIISLAQEVI